MTNTPTRPETMVETNENADLSMAEIVEVLRAKASEYPTQKQAAKAMGISEQYLSDMLAGYRSVGPAVAASFGYWRTAVYRKIPLEIEEHGK